MITTDDGANLLFSFSGYNLGVSEPFEYNHRTVVAALTLTTADERYRWANTVFAVLEADVRPSADPELRRVRAFECINQIATEPRTNASAPTHSPE